MPDDLELLRKRIEDGVEAAEEYQRILQLQDRKDRGERKKRFRLIKGGLIWGAVTAGVEWLRGYARTAATLAVSGAAVTGVVIAEQPHSPGADPPQAIKPPGMIRPSALPSPRPKATPTPTRPRSTSPPRTQVSMRIPPPPAATTQPAKPKKLAPVPTRQPSTPVPTVSLPVTPTVSTPSLPVEIVTTDACTLNLLGVRVCLPLG